MDKEAVEKIREKVEALLKRNFFCLHKTGKDGVEPNEKYIKFFSKEIVDLFEQPSSPPPVLSDAEIVKILEKHFGEGCCDDQPDQCYRDILQAQIDLLKKKGYL